MNRWQRNYLVRRWAVGPILRSAIPTARVLAGLVEWRPRPLDRPIFLLGCSRSGTTMFVRELSRHFDVVGWSEAAQIFEPNLYDTELDHVKSSEDATASDVFRIRFLFGLRSRFSGGRRLMNKHPENSLRISWLRAIFPTACFLHLVRHPIPVVASHIRKVHEDPFRRRFVFGNFPKPPSWRDYAGLPAHLMYAHQWREILAAVLRDGPSFKTVRYEDFCVDPRNWVRFADEALGLDPSRRPRVDYDAFRSRNGQFLNWLSEDQADEVWTVVAPIAAQFGYRRREPPGD